MKFLLLITLSLTLISCDLFSTTPNEAEEHEMLIQQSKAKIDTSASMLKAAQETYDITLKTDPECVTDECISLKASLDHTYDQHLATIRNGTFRHSLVYLDTYSASYSGSDSIQVTFQNKKCNSDGTFESDTTIHDFTYQITADSVTAQEQLDLYFSRCMYFTYMGESSSIFSSWNSYSTYNYDTSKEFCTELNKTHKENNSKVPVTFSASLRLTFTQTDMIEFKTLDYNCFADDIIIHSFGKHPSYTSQDCNAFTFSLYDLTSTFNIEHQSDRAIANSGVAYKESTCTIADTLYFNKDRNQESCQVNSCEQTVLKTFCEENFEQYKQEKDLEIGDLDPDDIAINTDAKLFEEICEDIIDLDPITLKTAPTHNALNTFEHSLPFGGIKTIF